MYVGTFTCYREPRRWILTAAADNHPEVAACEKCSWQQLTLQFAYLRQDREEGWSVNLESLYRSCHVYSLVAWINLRPR